MVLKMPGPYGVISIRGDVKWAFDCDRESCEMADRLSVCRAPRHEAGLGRVPSHPVIPDAKTSKTSNQSEDSLSKTISLSMEEPSKVAHVGNNLDPK
jgi:hypothetical protein